MYDKLPASEKAKFEELAAEHNEMIKGPPPVDHIYQYVILDILMPILTNISRNQGTIIENVARYLASLDGNDWGQCGDVVFFLQGAYRDAEGATKTFQYVFSTVLWTGCLDLFHYSINYDKRSGKKFELALSDWPAVRKAFSRWAKEALHVVRKSSVSDYFSKVSTSRCSACH
jgi:hypothetical protein